jgi:hypothetical protein
MPKQNEPGAQADVPESSPAIGAVRFSVPLTLPSAREGVAGSTYY